jgi:hypothetical protein
VSVIDGAIQRINIPAQKTCAVDRTGFLRQNGMFRVSAMDRLDECLFNLVINFGDQIGASFESHLVGTVKAVSSNGTGFKRPLNHLVKCGLG